MVNKALFRLIFLTLISLTLLVLFRLPISEALDALFVKPVFSKVAGTSANTILVLFIGAIMLCWFWMVSDIKFRFGFAEIVILFYITQRFNGYWHFSPSTINTNLYLWDIVIISILLPRVKLLLPLAENNTENATDGFIEEKPITDVSNDDFKRNVVAMQIAETIKATQNTRSFAIGVLGDYGSGKTSFINLIKSGLGSSVELIDFNPWSSENASDIQKDFFDTLSNHISKIDPKLSHLILSYSRKLRQIDTNLENLIKKIGFLNSLLGKDGHSDDHSRIDEILNYFKKKIVITIDDLDRLHDAEIMEVLKLIRNTANFANIVFIVAYERGYIQEAIQSLNRKASSSYLDKIIQLEIPLPKREGDDLLQLLERHLAKVLSPEDVVLLKDKIIPDGFKNSFDFNYKTVFRNSRDVIKFANSLIIPYRLLSGEVLFKSLFVLELIKFRFPLVYDQLYENPSKFISKKPSHSNYNETFELNMIKEDKRSRPAFTEVLKDDYGVDDLKLLSGLFISLFSGSIKDNGNQKSIINPIFFERYFKFRLGKEISEIGFQKAWKSGIEDMKSYIDKCVNENLQPQVMNRIFQQKNETRKEFELMIESLFHLGSAYVKHKSKRSFDYQALINKLWNYDNEVVKKFYKYEPTKYSDFLRGLFEAAISPFIFENELIYNIVDRTQEIGLDNSELVFYQTNYVKKYVDANGFTDKGIWLMWGVREHYSLPASEPGKIYKKWRFPHRLSVYISKMAMEKDPILFLAAAISTDPREKNYAGIQPHILEMFRNPEDLKKVAEKNPHLRGDVRLEFCDFFERCKAKDFKVLIDYQFKTALRPKGQTEIVED